MTIQLTGGVPAGFTGTLPNTATVESPTDTTPTNNTSTITGTASPSADITVSKTRTSGPVVPGTTVTWLVTVVNNGPSVATGVTLRDDLNDALTGVTSTPSGGPLGPGNLLDCSLGDLTPGQTVR